MPYSLKTETVTVSTSNTDVYTCGGDNAIVIGLSLTNNGASDIEVNLTFYSDSGGTTIDIVAPETVIEPGETIVPVGGIQKMVMNKDDIIKCICDTANGVDVILSAMELTDYEL